MMETSGINNSGMGRAISAEQFLAIKAKAGARLNTPHNEPVSNTGDARFNLAEIIRQKKGGQPAALGAAPLAGNAKATAKVFTPNIEANTVKSNGVSLYSALSKANELLMYGMDSKQESKTSSKQMLGNYIDLTA